MSTPLGSNLSLYAIPAYYLITLFPHSYAIRTVTRANNGRWDNANPRSSNWTETLQKTLPAHVYARYERAEAAHKNGMENLPLFATAITLGNLAKLSNGTLNGIAFAYLLSRVVYTFIYINVDKRKLSFARSATWGVGTMMCLSLIVMAANKLRVTS